MRIITAVAIAVCLLLTGYVAADLRTSDNANAGTTWQYQVFADHDGFDEFLSELPASCAVEFETLELIDGVTYFLVIHACPD